LWLMVLVQQHFVIFSAWLFNCLLVYMPPHFIIVFLKFVASWQYYGGHRLID